MVQGLGTYSHVVPSHIRLAKLEPALSGALDSYRLKEALDGAAYDFIVLDCPPSLGSLTLNALVAATHVVVPVKPSTYGISAVADFMETLEAVQRRLNPELQLLGILLTLYDARTTMAKDVTDYLQETYGDKLLPTHIGVNIRLDEAASAQQSIFRFDPSSHGAHDYMAFVEEVLHRAKA